MLLQGWTYHRRCSLSVLRLWEEVETMPAQQELARYRTDALSFEQHRQEFLQRYPERWMAVYNQPVVGPAKRLPHLLQELEPRGLPRGLPRGQVFIEHVSSQAGLRILPSRCFAATAAGSRGGCALW